MPRLPRGMVAVPKSKEPQRARSAYFLFSDAERRKHNDVLDPELDGKSMAIASKVLSARWKALPADQKKPFEEEAAKLKKAFKEKREQRANDADRPHAAKRRKLTLPAGWRAVRAACSADIIVFVCQSTKKAQWTLPTPDQAVEIKPTAEKLFLLDQKAKNVSIKNAKKLWKEASAEVKAEYKERASSST